MHEYTTKYVGMDVHKETIAVAIAQEGRSEPVYNGETPNSADAIRKLVKKVVGAFMSILCGAAISLIAGALLGSIFLL